MMASNHSQLFIAYSWGMDAISIAKVGRTPGFILCKPPVNAVSQAASHYPGIICESVGRITNEPSALILQDHGEIPVIERGDRTNASSEQCIDQAIVKIQT